jgi:hypothetical protein
VIFPLLFSLALIFLSSIGSLFQRKINLIYADLTFFIPVISGIVVWFFSAPDPRFAHGSFFLFLLGAIIMFSSFLSEIAESKMGMLIGRVSIFTFTVTAVFSLLLSFYPSSTSKFHNKYPPIPMPVLKEIKTESGLTLFVPTTSDQCWAALLPCTPSFNPKLKLRKDGYLSSGFTVK